MSDRSTVSGRGIAPLSPTPRRWTEVPPTDEHNQTGPSGVSPGGSPFGVRTQAVINDVERMLSRLNDAAEEVDQQKDDDFTEDHSRDSFYTAATDQEEETVSRNSDQLAPPLRPFLSTRRSAEALRPRSEGVSRLDPARMNLFSPPQPSRLRKAESNNSLSQLFGERIGRGESAFGGLERVESPVSTPTRSRLMGSRDSPLGRSFRPEEENEKTPTSDKIVRPRSTPPREQTIEKDESRTASPSKDMFGPRLRPKLPPRRPTTEDPATPTVSSIKSCIRPLNTPRMPPPLPPRMPSVDRFTRDPDAESISGTSIDCTSSEAGRELDKALESIGSGHSRASTSIGSLLSTESGYTSNGIAPRNVPLPASPASSRLAQSEVRENAEDSLRTPRAVQVPLSIPHTATSNPYPAPARSWIRDPYVARTLDNMGIEGPRRELLTPVEERTERTKSWSSGITPEANGKPLPLVPPIDGLPRSLFSTPTSANVPRTPTAARASNLIKFFESAASTGLPQSVPMERTGLSPGHWRGLSEPGPAIETTASNVLQPIIDRPTSSAARAVAVSDGQHSGPTTEGALAHLRRGRISPLRSVRNVVAAWRGRVMPLSRSGSMNSFNSDRVEHQDDHGLVEDQREAKGDQDKDLVDDAFFAIRRKSTKRRPTASQIPSNLPRYDSINTTVGSPAVMIDKPLPTIQGLRNTTTDAEPMRSRGQIVSTYSTMTSDPIRIGELWYLNVHGGEPFTWIQCDAELYHDRLVLSWMPEGSRGSRGVVTLDLAHCQEVRSVPSPNHPSARDDVGSVAARQHSVDLANSLYPFQLVYEDGLERLGCSSARDRVRWVSAIWDVLENGPDRSDNMSNGIHAPSSESGSATTRLQSPQMIDRRSSLHRNSRAMDDGLIRDSQGSMFPVTRNLSKRVNLNKGAGSMLRRIASEADLALGENVMNDALIGYNARPGPNITGFAPNTERPVSPSTSLLTETDVGPSASVAVPTTARLEDSRSTSDVFGTAFSIPTLERRSAQRAPRSQITSYRTPLSALTTGSQATVRPSARREVSDQFDGISMTSYDPNVLDMLDEESVVHGEIENSKSSVNSRRRRPRPPSYSRQETRGTNYFTASQGTLESYVSARETDRDSMVSSDWHGASAIDRATTVSSTTIQTASREDQVPSTETRTINSQSAASSVISRVGETTISAKSSTGPRSSSYSTSIVSSTSTRKPDSRLPEESANADNKGMRTIRSQLNRIEEQVAGIGSFLAVDKVSGSVKGNVQRAQESAVFSSSSSDTSSSSSSASSSPPSTPSSDQSSMKREVIILKDYMEDMLDRSDDLISGQERLRQLMEDKLVPPPDHLSGRAPTLHRIEDLLLRLLVRAGDSEILDEYGHSKEYDNLGSVRSPTVNQSASGHSRFSDPETELSTETDVSSIRAPAPPGSLASGFQRKYFQDETSDVPSSLLVTTPRIDGELDEEWELQNLPRGTPPPHGPRRRAAPPDLSHLRGMQQPPMQDEDYPEEMPQAESPSSRSETSIAPRRAPPVAPIPPPLEHDLPRTPESRTPTPPRPRNHRPGPLPRPLDVPSPVMPGRPSTFVPNSLRPGTIPPMMPRPSRLAGTREPMTTTYFRRGFPPPMFPPPMVGPHMGPYASGAIPPGLTGFGGPFGPNVFPRPGYPPPGAMGPDGYGLPRRPFFPPRPPRGDFTPQSRGSRTLSYTSYSDASSDGTLEEVKDAIEHLDEVQHQAIDAGQALAEAQVTQQNEISRYLHEIGDAMNAESKDHYNELKTLHEDIGRIRDQLSNPQTQVKVIAPETGPVPPPKTPVPSTVPVITTTTSVPVPPETQAPIAQLPVQTSVSVNVPPQSIPAAVMTLSEHSNQASPVRSALPLAAEKDLEQDAMLRDLQRKVADLMLMVAPERRGRTTEVEVSHAQPGDVETVKITEVEKGPGPLPPKSSAPQETIRITESQSGPIAAAEMIPSPAIIEHQPTIISTEPLKVSSSGPSVHFAPEHVKETVTEQVIKGPGNVPVVEKETVREYDRTPSDVAAGRAPRHETIVERETVSGPAGQPGSLEKTTEIIHDQPPLSVVPPSTLGSDHADHVVIHTHPDGMGSTRADVVEVVRNPSKRSKGSRAGTHVPKTTVVVEEDTAGHPIVTTTIEEHDTGGRYPVTNAPPTVLVHDSASQAPPRTTRVPTVATDSNPSGTGAPATVIIDHQTTVPATTPVPVVTTSTQPARPSTQVTIPASAAAPAPAVVELPASGPQLQPVTSTSNIPPGLAVRPVPVVADPVTTTANVKPAPSKIIRDQPIAVPNNPVKLSDPPAVQDPIILGDPTARPVPSGGVLGDRPASTANVPVGHPAQTPRPPSVVKQKPPPPRPVFDENDFAPPVESTPTTRPLAPTVPANAPAPPQTVANVPAGTETSKPVGLLRKQPPVQQAPPIVSDANVPVGAAKPNEPRVHFDTPVDSSKPVSSVGNVPAVPPTAQTPAATVTPSVAPVVLPPHPPAAVPSVQPVTQRTPVPAPGIVHQTSAPVMTSDTPSVQPQPVVAPKPKPLQSDGLANVPTGGSTKVPAPTKPIRENAAIQPTPAVASPAPVVTSDTPQTGAHNIAPHGANLNDSVDVAGDTTGAQAGRKPNVLKKAPPTHVQQDRIPGNTSGGGGPTAIHTVPVPAQDPSTTLGNVPGQPGPSPIRKGHPTVDDGSHVQDPLSRPGAAAPKPNVVPPATGLKVPPAASPSGLPTQGSTPEAALAERDRIAAQSKANAERAEQERLEKERAQKEREAADKLASDRHREHQDALSDIKKTLQDHGTTDNKWKQTYADDAKAKEKRRADRADREKKWQDALDKLILERETDKKWRESEGKKPGSQAVMDALKKHNDDLTAFLRSLAADIVAQNANQHQQTQQAAKAWAREQVAFNIGGYLDDFSKGLIGEVKQLLSEVGQLRETRRALYYELAELLLMKGRQSHGDLMAVLPFPTGNGVGPGPGIALPKAAPPKPAPAPKAEPPKPQAPPAWQTYSMPPNMSIGNPGGAPQAPSNAKKPPGGARPLPIPDMVTTTTTTHA